MREGSNRLPVHAHPELADPEVRARIMEGLRDSDITLFVSQAYEADDGEWGAAMHWGIVDPYNTSPDQQAVTFED